MATTVQAGTITPREAEQVQRAKSSGKTPVVFNPRAVACCRVAGVPPRHLNTWQIDD